MANAAIDIPNLLYRYADLFDSGDFLEVARLFDAGCIVVDGHEIQGAEAIAGMWQSFVHIKEDGTPRTRHLITNPLITMSKDGQSSTCRSQWTVLQMTETLPLQVISSGRYLDSFALIDGEWRFTRREYGLVDFWGNIGEHLKMAPPVDTAT